MEHSYEFVNLYPEQIKKDPKYQREIDVSRIKKITKHWDDDLVNPPKVSLRENGNYYVFNGQHTLAAWKKRYGNRPILCKVYRGLTETEEKDLFVKQEGFAKAVGQVEKLRAEYNAGTQDVVDMVKCATIAGCIIDFETLPSNSKNRINAIAAAYNCYKSVGHDHFINILDILRRAFYGDQLAFQDGFIKGMGYLFKNYSDQFSIGKMVEALSRQPVEWYRQKANMYVGQSSALKYAKAFSEQYNKRKSRGRIEIGE
jgi:hypothetical protein